jgi:catechol 2,3-dioxygenase-like lactoylglutathione lyase family enzyme
VERIWKGDSKMTRTSWVELCVSDFEQSITWFERVLGFRVVARDANDYAELSRGETFIQLATDHAPYWEAERLHLLPAGQRGSGVEIVLLVEDADAVYRQAQQAQADIVRPLADYPWHLRQFWVRHPDGYLIRPAQRLLSVNPTAYRRQVANAFEQGVPRIREALLPIKETADQLALQGDVLGAATIYETMVNEIFAHSHLYYEEDDYNDDDEEGEEGYYPKEEGLEELVEECVEALGTSLADPQLDRVVREKIIAVLFAIYQRDVNADESHDFGGSASDYLVQYTQPLERQTLATQVHALLSDEDEGIVGRQRPIYGQFLLDLERDTLDDEAYLRICRETGRISDLVERLLTLGRIDEAVGETEQRSDSFLTHLADLFLQHGHEALAERLVRARLLNENPNDLRIILEWLRKYYQARGNAPAELEIAERQFRLRSSLRGYQELRTLAERLQRWDTLRPEILAFLEPARNTTLLIEIALDEGDIDGALQRLQGMARQDRHGYTYDGSGYYGRGSIALTVAKKAEESRPRAAIELYRQYVERLIALRERKNYQEASEYLVKVRVLYEKLGEMDVWATYIAALREQNRALRALKEELARVGL